MWQDAGYWVSLNSFMAGVIYRRHNLTSKDDPRTKIIKICITSLNPCSKQAKLVSGHHWHNWNTAAYTKTARISLERHINKTDSLYNIIKAHKCVDMYEIVLEWKKCNFILSTITPPQNLTGERLIKTLVWRLIYRYLKYVYSNVAQTKKLCWETPFHQTFFYMYPHFFSKVVVITSLLV